MVNSFLAVNIGSTSIKVKWFDDSLSPLAYLSGALSQERGLSVRSGDGSQGDRQQEFPRCGAMGEALNRVMDLCRHMSLESGFAVVAAGHRVVHGGSGFHSITPIDREVRQAIESLCRFAPLHNPLNMMGIDATVQAFPEARQFAVFDTAFHRTLPEHASRYAIPNQVSEDIALRRYGFHGISCSHVLHEASLFLGYPQSALNLIVLHLGGGASATAIRRGVSIDTSMGFSPAEGLIMNSRCGDLDPMVPVALLRGGLSVDGLDRLLNHESGLVALCGTGDMRTIVQASERGDGRAALALEMYCYRIKKYIGAYTAALGEVSALVFTGGVGENAAAVREKILEGLARMGYCLDCEANGKVGEAVVDIADGGSPSRILVIHADEEREIARQMKAFLQGN